MSRSLVSRFCSSFFLQMALRLLLLLVSLLSTGVLFALWMSYLDASSVPVGVREKSRCCIDRLVLEDQNAHAVILIYED
jgi:hypothetical protein